MIPSLPQKDSPSQQQQRKQELSTLQSQYIYDHDTRVQPLGVAQAPLPKGQNFSFIWGLGTLNQALGITANLISIGSRIFDARPSNQPNESSVGDEELSKVEEAYLQLKAHHLNLSRIFDQTHVLSAKNTSVAHEVASTVQAAVGAVTARFSPGGSGGGSASHLTPSDIHGAHPALPESLDQFGENLKSTLGELLHFLVSEIFELFLRYVGLYGQASGLSSYQAQFQLLPLPRDAGVALDDLMFARLRVAGPNPVVIRRITAPDSRFPVTDAHYRLVMGEDDSLEVAGKEGRLYLADYQVLEGVQAGTYPTQKYFTSPLALFAVPKAGSPDRLLRAVAIQCTQQPGASNPIFTPKDGLGWQVARLFVQVADGYYHEMISHLGLTHLLVEAFVMATARQLAPEHPLNVLLTPHFQGTLAINNAAVESLIAPQGFVDRLLPGSIQASTQLAVDAVLRFQFNHELFPLSLAARGVDDAEALPDYPYRDDGKLIWDSIHGWVVDYLSLYYGSDEDVAQDYELQAWLAELTSEQGGGLQDIGQDGAIRTLAYLADLVTMIIFTGSAQHATVNFPQSYVMSYTPSLPLAAYAPAPTAALASQPANVDALLAYMPPLQQSFMQQTLMELLGKLYFTRLGAYDRYSATSYFQDPRVRASLKSFQQRLEEAESIIARRNLHRIPYRTLLPSEIPQSINI
ncbi:lipoxygenase family protein [Vitiosangium sp. GDMCC 1.1324]|uniref:lipoxygenase family protein n=1 Tax=Vitiosangium sp. (strain GDMCC 1.1324) TaxID=2138576 RepID=UPI000D3ABA9E|nr:lipoxygenase family protein [Vitiosangium sp. GDMCC 1.1324]PTL84562.1 lipoxygenase [Vitiosangium sp. GDMCC 1.1324]